MKHKKKTKTAAPTEVKMQLASQVDSLRSSDKSARRLWSSFVLLLLLMLLLLEFINRLYSAIDVILLNTRFRSL